MSVATAVILEQVLGEIMKVTSSQGVLSTQIKEVHGDIEVINKTIHNGLSSNIKKNSETLEVIAKRLEYIEGKCPLMKTNKDKKKKQYLCTLSATTKTIMWTLGLFISLGTAIGIWTTLF